MLSSLALLTLYRCNVIQFIGIETDNAEVLNCQGTPMQNFEIHYCTFMGKLSGYSSN